MKKYFVALISEQAAANLLLIKHFFFIEIDYYMFISTPEMEHKNKSNHLKDSAGIQNEKLIRIVVNGHDLLDVIEKLEKLDIEISAAEFHVNLTGGNKLMLLGAFTFFNKKGIKAFFYYLPLGEEYFWVLSPQQGNQKIYLENKLSVNTYLSSYGLKELPAQFTPIMRSFAYLEELLGHYLDNSQAIHYKNEVYRIRKLFNQKQKATIDLTRTGHIKTFLKTIRFPVSKEGQLLAIESQFLIGGWFEIYIYELIKQHLHLDASSITLQSKIQGLERKVMASTSEFDILFFYERVLYVVECKTGLGGKYPKLKNQLDPALYRLAALKKIFGMNVKVSLVTLSAYLRDKDGEIRASIRKRSEDLGVQIIDQKLLLQPPSVWLPILLDEK